MSDDIKKLKEMILSDAKLSLILRHALVVAHTHDTDAVSWITQEMHGYKAEEAPEYRRVRGVPHALDSYTGVWKPHVTNNSKLQEVISNAFVGNSIAALEDYVNSPENVPLTLPYPSSIQEDFAKNTDWEAHQFVLHVNKSALSNILNSVRYKLLEWVLSLDHNTESNPNATPSDSASLSDAIFPTELMSQMPSDIEQLADDFNFNFSHKRAYPCMLIMRRMLPLSIVRKFQMDNKEGDIKDENGDYLNPLPLLNKATPLVSGRAHKDVVSCKMLLDASQHSYAFRPGLSDVKRTATALRLFLEELFSESKSPPTD